MTNNVIFFDGVCNFCNSSVNFIIDHDKKKKFLFASLQSEAGKQMLKQFNIPQHKELESIILFKDNKVYRKSTALLEIVKNLGGIWPVLYFLKIIPAFIRDFFYNFVSKNRYRVFGKRESCRVPEPEIKSRFIG